MDVLPHPKNSVVQTAGTAFRQTNRTLQKVAGDISQKKSDFTHWRTSDGKWRNEAPTKRQPSAWHDLKSYKLWERMPLISDERLVKHEGHTPVHQILASNTNQKRARQKAKWTWKEEITREIPNVGEDALKDLHEMNRIIRHCAEASQRRLRYIPAKKCNTTNGAERSLQLKNASCIAIFERQAPWSAWYARECTTQHRWCRSRCSEIYTCKRRRVAIQVLTCLARALHRFKNVSI